MEDKIIEITLKEKTIVFSPPSQIRGFDPLCEIGKGGGFAGRRLEITHFFLFLIALLHHASSTREDIDPLGSTSQYRLPLHAVQCEMGISKENATQNLRARGLPPKIRSLRHQTNLANFSESPNHLFSRKQEKLNNKFSKTVTLISTSLCALFTPR